MPIKIDLKLRPDHLRTRIETLFDLAAAKILSIERTWKPSEGTPVFTVRGRYTSRGWTEWTQGFQFGAAFLQFEATGDRQFLNLAREKTRRYMASHVSHTGVHDHGFNNISTYGNWLRLIQEARIESDRAEAEFCQLALKASGAVQASRWTRLQDGTGFIHSFNGPHSLFVDTLRSLRVLAAAHQLGHVLMGEQDAKISLLRRALEHAFNTARYSIYYGEGRDAYDLPGRTAHEAVFNTTNGVFRCPNSQQGFSPFTTWTRGLAWAICGFAEQLEFLQTIEPAAVTDALQPTNTVPTDLGWMRRAAVVTAEFYLANTCTDGIPMWDTGAPQLARLGNYETRPSDPFNRWEPVDSSAAAIAAQGLLRLGRVFEQLGESKPAKRYRQAGLTVAATLLDDPYLSREARHQGLLLHSVYHRPNGWDYIASGQKVPNGESSMWGDYHLLELGLMLLREIRGEPPLTFFTGLTESR